MTDSSKDALAWQLARSQYWLVTLAQLIGIGFDIDAVKHRLARGRLWRVYPGVYAVGHPDMSPERERMAATLACGDGAGLSHLTGLLHWRVWEGTPPARHHVSIPTRSGRSGSLRHGSITHRIHIHRPRTLVPDVDTVVHRGIRVTSLARSAQDVAGIVDPRTLRSVLRQMERVHAYDLRELAEVVADASPKAWRAARLRRTLSYILDDSGATQTEREALYLDICRRFDLGHPRPQRPIGTRRADFVFDDIGLIVEIDDRQSHDTYAAFTDDRKRDRDNANRGFETIRFTVAECRHEPELVARDTAAAMERCRRRSISA